MEDKLITISEKELLKVLAAECANIVKEMGEKESGGFNMALTLLMSAFSARVASKIMDLGETSSEQGYHYSERGGN